MVNITHQIKTTMRYHLTLSEWLLWKSLQTINAGEDAEKREPSQAVCVNANYFSHCGEQCSVKFSSVAQSCPTLCDPMNRSTPALPVHHQLPEFTQTQVHRVRHAIQPSHPLSSPSPPAPNPSQHQSLFQWVNSSHEVAKVMEFQLQHHSCQRTPRADLPVTSSLLSF